MIHDLGHSDIINTKMVDDLLMFVDLDESGEWYVKLDTAREKTRAIIEAVVRECAKITRGYYVEPEVGMDFREGDADKQILKHFELDKE
jgi:hypothetical protein